MLNISSLPSLISPYILHTPWISIRWYGVMYVLSIIVVYLVATWRIKHEKCIITKEQFTDALIWGFIGMVIGARLLYVFIYDPSYYLANPLQIIWPFEGSAYVGLAGFSYHGGLIGAILGLLLYCKKFRIRPWDMSDLIIPVIPIGYFFGRIGNFLNDELYGRVTSVPWGMYFPSDPTGKLRHPSQLYEALLEGIVCFLILWFVRKRIKGPQLFGLYLVTYAIARIIVEFFREPDPQLGFIFGALTMGQVLSGLMLCVGLGFVFFQRKISKKTIV
ncbi:MAG: prolipoprotein diacylglyceryl transferase [Patescibacteria group bacterium]